MTDPSRQTREALADKLRSRRRDLAETATTRFLGRHPDWLERYGERARTFGEEDAGYHLDFLAGAIQIGSEETFADYARWAGRVLRSRGIDSSYLGESLADIAEAAREKLSPEEARAVLRLVAAGRRALSGPPAVQPGDASDGPLDLTRRLFTQAILTGQRRGAERLAMLALQEGHAVSNLYVEVLQKALYEVGRRWETNRITVAEEHMATAITQYVMAQLYPRIPAPEEIRGRAVMTGIQGELHHVGLQMVADLMEADGWDVRFLGTDLPSDGILQAVRDHEAEILGISVTMLFNLPRAEDLIREVRRQRGPAAPHILVGGGAFRTDANLWRQIGADGFAADALSVRELLRSAH